MYVKNNAYRIHRRLLRFFARLESKAKILESLSALNLNSYFYCPKEDPFHRLEWAEDYSDEYLLNLGSFFESAKSLNIELIFGISPGFVSESIDQTILNNKIQAIFDLGIRSLCILFDDISFEATKQKGRSMQKF